MDKVLGVELQVGDKRVAAAELLAGKKYALLYFSGA
jgi:hypothetical protein